MPLEFSGPGIQSKNAIGEQIVTRTGTIVRVGPGIAGSPVEGVGRGVVGACEPGRTTPGAWWAALPGFYARLTRARHCPTPPNERAIVRLERGDEAANPFIGAGDTGDDHVVDDERDHGAAVVLTLGIGRQRNFPKQSAGPAVKREQVGVVGNEENLIA